MTPKERIEKAKELYKAGKYQAARNELAKVDHPKAKEWITHIDAQHGTKPMTPLSPWLFGGIALVSVTLVVTGILHTREIGRAISAQVDAEFACADLMHDALYETYGSSEAWTASRSALFDATHDKCATWVSLIDEDVLYYCTEAYNEEAADLEIKRYHLLDCILNRESESMGELLSLSIGNLGGMIENGTLITPTPWGEKSTEEG